MRLNQSIDSNQFLGQPSPPPATHETVMSGLSTAHCLVDTLNGVLGDLQGRISAVLADSSIGNGGISTTPVVQAPEAVGEVQRLNSRLQSMQYLIEDLVQRVRV